MANREKLDSITELEQHSAEGIEIKGTSEPWANKRLKLQKDIEQQYAELLQGYGIKDRQQVLDKLVGQELEKRAKQKAESGDYKDLHEKVMYEHWRELEEVYRENQGLRRTFEQTRAKVESLLNNFMELEKGRRTFKRHEEARGMARSEVEEQKEQFEVAEWMTRQYEAGNPIPETYQERVKAMQAEQVEQEPEEQKEVA